MAGTGDGRGLLVLNAGSSSLKAALYDAADLAVVATGEVVGLTGAAPTFSARLADGETSIEEPLDGRDHGAAIARLLAWLDGTEGLPPLVAAGHRIVHGGGVHDRPAVVDAGLIADLKRFVPFAPRHQPHNIAGIEALAAAAPDLPQVACFDTAFHETMPAVRKRLPVPADRHAAGLRRYGFHGLSYQSIVARFESLAGQPLPPRTVIAHLGAGASLCAVRDGRGVYTTMGFSPLDGLMMATRPGRLDPGAVLHLIRSEGLDADALETLLYDGCGLAGVSGLGGDMKTLMESADPSARLAVDLYTDRLVQEIAAAAAALDGFDALVFTGGVGENAAGLRAAVVDRLAWLGMRLDAGANAANGPRITLPTTEPAAFRIPTDEQRVIAEACCRVLL